MSDRQFRRWFQLSLKSLFLLTLETVPNRSRLQPRRRASLTGFVSGRPCAN
jgi:hypothetical protein